MIGAVTGLQVTNSWKSERSILCVCAGPAAAEHSELLIHSMVARVKLTVDSQSLALRNEHREVNSVLGQYAVCLTRLNVSSWSPYQGSHTLEARSRRHAWSGLDNTLYLGNG